MTATVQPSRRLESYVCGEWAPGQKTGATLLDAATGAEVATIDSSGIDFADVLDHGRKAGARLRAMSFHDRALMLRALGMALMERKEEFYAESFRTGATRADGWVLSLIHISEPTRPY